MIHLLNVSVWILVSVIIMTEGLIIQGIEAKYPANVFIITICNVIIIAVISIVLSGVYGLKWNWDGLRSLFSLGTKRDKINSAFLIAISIFVPVILLILATLFLDINALYVGQLIIYLIVITKYVGSLCAVVITNSGNMEE